jgi:Co/Zn/Cd efflux system component
VFGIAIVIAAIRIGRRPADAQRTFGYERFEILAAVVNAVLLFGVGLYILIEAYRRLSEPPEIQSTAMLVIALIGLGVNFFSMRVLASGHRRFSTSARTDTSRAEVGSSSSSSPGSRMSARDGDALALPARELLRVAEAETGPETDRVERFRDLGRPARDAMDFERQIELRLDGLARVQRAIGILKHHLAHARQRSAAGRPDRLRADRDRPRARRDQTGDGPQHAATYNVFTLACQHARRRGCDNPPSRFRRMAPARPRSCISALSAPGGDP